MGFTDILLLGRDKNGDMDYRLTVANVEGLGVEQMREFRSMALLALFEAEEWWRRSREGLPENQAKAEPRRGGV